MHSHLSSSHVMQISVTSKNRGQNLSKQDCLSALAGDEDFSCIVDEGDSASAMYCADNRFEFLNWSDGKIDAEYPSDSLVEKLDGLALKLDARLVVPKVRRIL